MMLNDRGRVLYDTIVYRPTKICDPVGTEYLIELDTNYLQKALQFFNVMKFKKKVQIKTVDDQFALFAITPSERSCNNLVKPIELSDATNAHICSDPRHASLGSRLILKVSETNTKANIKSRFVSFFPCFFFMYNKVVYQVSELIKNLRVEENLSNYKKFLYKNGIAENGDDFVYGSSIPLEFNIVFLNGGNLVCLFLHENENKLANLCGLSFV
jgi:folate-binding Fe-S cluster repair protein YgfZ